jgi:N,N-dimethylformamidase beta subunit-like, C-terminal
VRSRRLGEHRVAVVLPTQTWQAYNFRDDNGDGPADTWYAGNGNVVRLFRPFLDRGVPYHFRHYDVPFLHWLARTGKHVDVLADGDLDRTTGGRLAAAYDLIVFPGHHEYVTTREYDAIEHYRDLGGNLMFLAANNFFWRVIRRHGTLTRTNRWRDLSRPEAALIGAEYRGNDRGQHKGPWIVRRTAATSWLFEGTGLTTGSRFGSGGIEIDATAAASPPGTLVLAEIPHLYGPTFTAQMTYYETPGGAKVFAAGAFNLVESVLEPDAPLPDRLALRAEPGAQRMLENLWTHLTSP